MREYWQDWVILFTGGWVFIAPWFYGFDTLPGAAWTAWIVGGLSGLLGLAALAVFSAWQHWGVIAAGLWLAVSPWVVGGAGVAPVTANFVLDGAILVASAALALRRHRGARAN